MFLTLRIVVSLLSIFLFSCDGPNEETAATTTSQRGVHNEDGFELKLKVNSGASVTSEMNVSVQLSALDAKEMYVTQESACNIGGEWEPIKTFKLVTMQKTNSINFFYVKVRNETRESDCAFTSIYHDSQAPSFALTSPADGATLIDPNQLPLLGTCTEDSKIVITVNSIVAFASQCIGGAWSKTLDTTLMPNGNIAISIKASDQANNTSSIQNFIFVK